MSRRRRSANVRLCGRHWRLPMLHLRRQPLRVRRRLLRVSDVRRWALLHFAGGRGAGRPVPGQFPMPGGRHRRQLRLRRAHRRFSLLRVRGRPLWLGWGVLWLAALCRQWILHRHTANRVRQRGLRVRLQRSVRLRPGAGLLRGSERLHLCHVGRLWGVTEPEVGGRRSVVSSADDAGVAPTPGGQFAT